MYSLKGLLIAILASLFLYLEWLGLAHPMVDTISAILALYLLLKSDKRVWFFSGFFIGILWFWWIAMSFRYYGFPWAMPIGVFGIALVYGFGFWLVALLAQKIEEKIYIDAILIKSIFLLTASYIHPFGFDWFKPELMFVQSYMGIQKWQFIIILMTISLSIYKFKITYLLPLLLAYQPSSTISSSTVPTNIELVTTAISIDDKWNPDFKYMQIDLVKEKIAKAIKEGRALIIFPESVLPLYLNKELELISFFKEISKEISIVIGALNYDNGIPRNSTYIFNKGDVKIANKVILVPFGESNPLPDWLGKWVNKIFYDGAIDYEASSQISDYTIDGVTYRNAICYEACSEALYKDSPKQMIVISNNGWFTPSIQPTQQRLLLHYYSRKYGTTIYHSVNMSQSYVVNVF